MDSTSATLLERIKDRNDQEAWREFDRLYRSLIRKCASSHGLDASAAEDAVQHCMAAIVQHIEQFEYDPSKAKFRGWLKTIVKNWIRNIKRLRPQPQLDSAIIDSKPDPSPTPDEQFEQIWLKEHLAAVLRDLCASEDAEDLDAFNLYVMKEQPVNHVCAKLKITPARLYKIKWQIGVKVSSKLKDLLGGQ